MSVLGIPLAFSFKLYAGFSKLDKLRIARPLGLIHHFRLAKKRIHGDDSKKMVTALG